MRIEAVRQPSGGKPRVETEFELMYLVSTTLGDRLVPARSTSEAWMLAQDMGYNVESISKWGSLGHAKTG